jgi:Activator of Hsp90 ATPase homolog 1-like protein
MSSTVIEPVRRSVGVDCDVEEAFEVFTAGIFTWWPVAAHSIGADDVRDVVFEGQVGGEVYEVCTDGTRNHWAEVVAWEPPHRFVLAWNTGPRRAAPTEVEVRFTPFEDGAGTRVELEHRAWERWDDGEEARASYHTGWEVVLGRYAERLSRKA